MRVEEIVDAHADWPCRKGCDECCRSLASAPLVTQEEWEGIAAAVDALPEGVARQARRRMEDGGAASRPIACPLLDTGSGSCLVYAVRPVACRAYGFYAEREGVLGCSRIEAIAAGAPNVLWGNHAALEVRLRELGEAKTFVQWLAANSPTDAPHDPPSEPGWGPFAAAT